MYLSFGLSARTENKRTGECQLIGRFLSHRSKAVGNYLVTSHNGLRRLHVLRAVCSKHVSIPHKDYLEQKQQEESISA